MLQKKPKPNYINLIKTSAKVLFIAEALFFAVSYGVYFRMNRDRDFRLYLNEKFPFVLEGFYKTGEFFDKNSKVRQLDKTVWSQIPSDN